MISVRHLYASLQAFIRFKELAKSIKMVALSLLHQLKKKVNSRGLALSSIVPFYTDVNYPEEFVRIMLVSIGVDKSMCGPHNSNVLSATERLVKRFKDSSKKFQLVTIGIRIKDRLRRSQKNYVTAAILNSDKEPISLLTSYSISEKLLEKDSHVERYFFIFNRYYSPFLQKTSVYELFALSFFIFIALNYSSEQTLSTSQHFYSFVYDISDALDKYLTDIYLLTFSYIVLDCLEENEYSGLGARITSMENSISNATNIIELKTLVYNKARQAQITNELIEIITCANLL